MIFEAPPPVVAITTIVIALTLVGVLDHETGANVHLFALYFIPLALASTWYGTVGAWTAAIVTAGVWSGVQYIGGAAHWELGTWALNFLIQGIAFLTVALLVATLIEHLEWARRAAQRDTLTGLVNRAGLFSEGAAIIALCRRHQRPVSLLYIDLDNFKGVNDTLGHAHGDALLVRCAELLQRVKRASDLAVRIGGDEFVLLLPESDRADAHALALRLGAVFETTAEFAATGVTASIGIASEARAQSTLSELMREADTRMYRRKREGRSRQSSGGRYLAGNAERATLDANTPPS